jgi:EmrB/QacA subfamily drug resistance transporter
MHSHHHSTTASAGPAGRVSWLPLILLSLAQFMVILDITVVNIALPSIGRELGFAAGDLQWVITAYVLVTGGLLLLGGRMADLLGRRRVFVAGLALFTVASLSSGLAASPEVLIASRALQGLGAALLSPGALSIITTTYAGAQRTKALGVWGALGAAGAAAGVIFGGLLTSLLSWEWVFFINVPIGAAVLALTLRHVPAAARADERSGLDLPGGLTVVVGLVALVYGIERAGEHGVLSTESLALLGLAAIALATFARVERSTRAPLIDPAIWRVRSLVSSAVVMMGATAAMIGAFFINSIFLQDVIGASALKAGLAFLPLTLVIGVSAHAGQHLLTRVAPRSIITAGLATVAGGYFLLAQAPVGASYVADLLPGFLLIGAGIGLVFVAVSVTGMSEVEHRWAGLASGLMTTGHEVGAALGAAVFSAVALGSTGEIGGGAAIAAGYADAATVGVAIAAGLAVLAALILPGDRISAGARPAMH